MPELPEVETVRRVLEPQLAGRTVERLTLARPEIIAHPTAGEFSRAVTGRAFRRLGRRGKFLQLELDDGATILLHLRMTGQLLATQAGHPEEKHTHAVFHLGDGKELRFIDARRFGRLWLVQPGEEDTFSGIAQLGPEPDDDRLTAAWLKETLGKSRRAIKECLLDQHVVAGIGNIYADEILFTAKIHPRRPANSLTEEEWRRLGETIPATMAFFVEKNDISAADYLAGRGQEYRNTPYLRAYGREGEPCTVCGAPLERIVIGGRSSCFCPRCQIE